jgi:hypothetical protein
VLNLQGDHQSPAITVKNSQEVVIINSTIQKGNPISGILSVHSDVEITNCLFEGNNV